MTKEMQVFNYNDNTVRTVMVDGEPWWVLKDVCAVLTIGNIGNVTSRLDDDEKGVHTVDTPGGKQSLTIISESGLYNAILLSRKPEAKMFRRWITHSVLPSIRRYGLYADKRVFDNPELLVWMGQAIIAEREKIKILKEMIEEDAPKVAFADAVSESDQVISFGQMAKILRENGVDIGRTRLCAELRNLGLLVSQRCVDYNTPTQKGANLKLFRLCARRHVFPDGRGVIQYTTRVTGKGQRWMLDYFQRKRGR